MLKNSDKLTDTQRAKFMEINQANLLTARAWKMKENFMEIFSRQTTEEAAAFFDNWYENGYYSAGFYCFFGEILCFCVFVAEVFCHQNTKTLITTHKTEQNQIFSCWVVTENVIKGSSKN